MYLRTARVAVAFGIGLLSSQVGEAANIYGRPDSNAPALATRVPWAIVIDGPIRPGDAATFSNVLTDLGLNHPRLPRPFIYLNSPGGSVREGTQIAALIFQAHAWTNVPGECSSVCFLMFVAGSSLSFAPSAKLGVHSAYDINGGETIDSLAATMLMIRNIQSYRIAPLPDKIMGMLVATRGTEISYLSRADLQDMGATMAPAASAPRHTEELIRQALSFADAHRDHIWLGDREAAAKERLSGYDFAYSTGTNAGECGRVDGWSEGCIAAAADYRAYQEKLVRQRRGF